MTITNIYKENGGAAYHAHKHQEQDGTVELIARFRAKKFLRYISTSDSVLEYGVGGGWNLRNIVCAEKVGYDVSSVLKPMLENYHIVFTTDQSLLPKGHFDVLICHHVLEHVINPLETLKELKTYMKPNGILLLFIPTDTSARFNKFDPNNKDHHLFNWNVQSLCTLATEAGFSVTEYKRSLYGFDRFVANFINRYKLPRFLFYPIFYLLNFLRPDREIKLVCRKSISLTAL